MAYKLEFRPSAEREFDKLSADIQARLRPKIDALASNPRPSGCKKLAGMQDLYRIRVGDYRIIYEIRDKVLLVLIVKIGHRGSVYE